MKAHIEMENRIEAKARAVSKLFPYIDCFISVESNV